jgi:hypothetical protein
MYSCVNAPTSGYLYTFLRTIGTEANPFNIGVSLSFEDSSISPSCDLNSDKLTNMVTPFISAETSITCQPSSVGGTYRVTFCNATGSYEKVCSDSLCSTDCVFTYAYTPSDYYNCTGGGGQFSKNACFNPYAPAPPVASTAPSSTSNTPTNGGGNIAPSDGGSNAPNGGGSNAPNGGGSNAPNGGGSNAPSSGSNAPNGGTNGAPTGTNTNAPAAPVAPRTPSAGGSSLTVLPGVIAGLLCLIAVFAAL